MILRGEKNWFKNLCSAFAVLLALLTLALPAHTVFGADNIPAFPGAEGGGKYTLGARGASSPTVYHVTNLNTKGTGSFADAVSKPGKIIVFDVGGTIHLNGTFTIKNSNLTILGQTAPGDGITLLGGDISIARGVENIIMRYLRVRPTDINGGEPDGIGGRWNKNIIIDHCSASWGVDELLTLYAGSSENATPSSNMTVQNCLATESLRMSNHFKGAHGYGAIFGGTNSTWHHNLLAHHDSRSPRLDRELQNTDVRNNVIYNWGQTNSAYGGEPYSYNNVTQTPSNVNWINNYYKFGPGTASKIKNRIFDISNAYPDVSKSNFYFDGNYMYGDANVTTNNWSGVNNSSAANKLSAPIDMGEYELSETQSAEEAYNTVLADAGATLPKRDSIDARIIADVKNQTGRIINNADEVAGLVDIPTTKRVFSIPDDWKSENGMGTASETNIVKSGQYAGYTWIEAYVNDWTSKQSAPTNPSIVVTNPAIQSISDTIDGKQINNGNWEVLTVDFDLNYCAEASPSSDDTYITKIEIYDGSKLVKTVNDSTVNTDITLTPGTHYISSRAYNNKGESTQSPTSIVYAKSYSDPGDFSHAQIGTTAFDGEGGSSLDNGVYTIMGSGAIGAGKGSDTCDFMYKEIKGDFDISVKADQVPKFENGELCGIMLRENLNGNSRMAMLSDGWLKYGQNVKAVYRTSQGGKSIVSWFKNSSGKEISNSDTYDTSKTEYRVPQYLRMQRKGDVITLSVSDSGTNWKDNPRQPQTITISGLAETLYVGLAVDSIQGTPRKEYMAEAKFSNLKLTDENATPTPQPTATPEPTEPPIPKYEIAIDENIQNGTIQIETESGIGSGGNKITWLADDNIPADAVEGQTNIFGDGKAVLNINGKDSSDGTFTFWDAVQWNYVDVNGTRTKVLKGGMNPTVQFPPSLYEPLGNVFSFTPNRSGYLTLELFLNPNKTFNLYDDTTESYFIKSYTPSSAELNTYVIPVEADSRYYAWANGSKIGLKSVTFSDKVPTAKEGETVKIIASPEDGYFVNSVNVDSGSVVEKTDENNYTFTMPAKNVVISAQFSKIGEPTNTPAPTAEPTAPPTAEPSAPPTTEPSAPPSANPPTATPNISGIYYKEYPKLENGKVTAEIVNTKNKNALFTIAVYDETNTILKDIKVVEIPYSLDSQPQSIEIAFSEKDNIKVYLWDDLLRPQNNVISLDK